MKYIFINTNKIEIVSINVYCIYLCSTTYIPIHIVMIKIGTIKGIL